MLNQVLKEVKRPQSCFTKKSSDSIVNVVGQQKPYIVGNYNIS